MPAINKGKVREWICLVVLFPSRSKSIRIKTVRIFVDEDKQLANGGDVATMWPLGIVYFLPSCVVTG
jgi:hypothetical protein